MEINSASDVVREFYQHSEAEDFFGKQKARLHDFTGYTNALSFPFLGLTKAIERHSNAGK